MTNKLTKIPEIKPQPHQEEAVGKYNKSKSLIAYHGLGSGKTLTSILAGQQTPGVKLVIGPAALKENYRKELHKFNIPEKDYHITSYEMFRKNPQALIDKHKPSMIIADEFHRTRDSESLTGDAIRQARKSVKGFVGLTGSIASNHPSEIADLVHTATGQPILGDRKHFNEKYIETKKVSPGFFRRLMGVKPGEVEVAKNIEKFRAKVSPYVHTFAGDKEYQKHLPTVSNEVKYVPMSNKQQRYYNFVFDQLPFFAKQKIKQDLPPSKREIVNMNAFLLGARQVSNTLKPYGVDEPTPKIEAVINDIKEGIKKDPHFKSVIYSSFVEGGLSPVSKLLEKNKIPFGEFTGAQKDSDRQQIVRDYNTGKLRTLLVSPAGGEGLDLKGTRLMGVLDQNWNREKTRQAIGRTARFKSHEALPLDKRNVRVVEYLSEPQLTLFDKVKKFFTKTKKHKIGVDEYIRNRSLEKERLNEEFTNVLKGIR